MDEATSNVTIEASFHKFGENLFVCDPESAFFRPFMNLVKSGRGGIKSVTPVLLLRRVTEASRPEDISKFDKSSELMPSPLYVRHLFGCFAVSGNDMLSFYPAMSFPQREMGRLDGKAEGFKVIEKRDWFKVDHFTLNNDLQEWHITGQNDAGKTKRLHNGTVEQLKDGLHHWFSMGVRRFRDFEILPRKYLLNVGVRGRDRARRQEIVSKSLQSDVEAGENLLTVVDGRQTSNRASLLHFEFFILQHRGFSPEDFLINPVGTLRSST